MEEKITKVGFVGLGAMGLGMAHRVNAQHSLVVYNRTAEKAADLVAAGARLAKATEELAECDIVCSMLSDDAAVETVFLSDGRLAIPLKKGAVHLSHSTVSPELVDRLADAHLQAGVELVGAPVLGRPDKAAAGELVAILAGADKAISRGASVIDAVSNARYIVGADPRQAAITKIGVNFLVAAALECLAESFAMVRKAGIDPEVFLSLTTETIFSSSVYEGYGALVARELNPEPGFKTTLGLKDVELSVHVASVLDTQLPVGELVASRLLKAIDEGYGNDDWSSLARLAAREAELSPIDQRQATTS